MSGKLATAPSAIGATTTSTSGTATTSAKVLQTLRLFVERDGRVCVADVMQALGVSSATAYRYLAELEQAGMASRFTLGDYVLGAEITALERAARGFDPYAAAAQPVIAALASETGASITFARLSGCRLVHVLDVPGPLGPPAPVNSRTLRIEPPTDAEAAVHLATRRGRKTVRLVQESDADTITWAAAIRLGSQVVGSVRAVLTRGNASQAPTQVADKLCRAALRIEGRLKAR